MSHRSLTTMVWDNRNNIFCSHFDWLNRPNDSTRDFSSVCDENFAECGFVLVDWSGRVDLLLPRLLGEVARHGSRLNEGDRFVTFSSTQNGLPGSNLEPDPRKVSQGRPKINQKRKPLKLLA